MTEYIDREKVIAEIDGFFPVNPTSEFSKGVAVGVAMAKVAVNHTPAADVRTVVKAEWYGEADGYADGELVYDIWSCPICGKCFEEWEEKPDWNFCPNCGADMREET